MGDATRELGWEDYISSPDDGHRHEIVDGEWVVTPPPTWSHQRAIGNLYLKLALFLEGRQDLEVFLSPCAVAIGGPNFVEPDIFVVPHDGRVAFEAARIAGAPVLTIEVLSPSTRRYDLVRKRRLYERSGVQEYWVVDPEDESVSVFHRDGDAGFGAPVKTFADAEGRVESRVLAGLELDVVAIFRRRT
jgi:Uma2 family endonuclease